MYISENSNKVYTHHSMNLVLDIGNFRIKGALFEDDRVIDQFVFPEIGDSLKEYLTGKTIERTLISSVNRSQEKKASTLFEEMSLSFDLLDFSTLNVQLDVEEPEQLGHDRIANIYGALFHFPQNDCIVVDVGTAVTFDYIRCDGHYLGGAIYPGLDIGAKGLAQYTDLLPLVEVKCPLVPVAKTTETHIQSGLYWGLLGAIERITFEMRNSSPNSSDVKVLGTGGTLHKLHMEDFVQDLNDFVDLIDPLLTLIGLHQIMKEKHKNV